MAIWSKLFTLGRAAGNEAASAVVDANALRILDQEIRDADKAQGKARDDLAGLGCSPRILEAEVLSFQAQIAKYEGSARVAVDKGMDLARRVAQRIADLEQDISMKAPAGRRHAPGRGTDPYRHCRDRPQDRAARREVDVVKVNESVQSAARPPSQRAAPAIRSVQPPTVLARIRERQMIRGEKSAPRAKLEDRRTGADLDEKLRLAGILPGQSSADDVLARLAPPSADAAADRAAPRHLTRPTTKGENPCGASRSSPALIGAPGGCDRLRLSRYRRARPIGTRAWPCLHVRGNRERIRAGRRAAPCAMPSIWSMKSCATRPCSIVSRSRRSGMIWSPNPGARAEPSLYGRFDFAL